MSDAASQSNENERVDGGAARWQEHFSAQFFLERVKAIVLGPVEAMTEIRDEQASVQAMYKSYLLVLIAIPVVCEYIRMVTFGISLPFIGTFRWPIFSGLVGAVVRYGLMLCFPIIAALIIEKLAPHFEARVDLIGALKLMACALTPGLAAGVLSLFPVIGFLGILFGLYGLYIFYLGAPILTGVSEAKRVPFLVVSFVSTIVVFAVLSLIVASISPQPPAPDLSSMSLKLNDGATINTNDVQDALKQFQGLVAQEK